MSRRSERASLAEQKKKVAEIKKELVVRKQPLYRRDVIQSIVDQLKVPNWTEITFPKRFEPGNIVVKRDKYVFFSQISLPR